jgi:FtsZ-interacting cell division protein ZipA
MPMAELRFILLIAGLVFLVALAAWELRKPRQAQSSAALRRPTRSEPELGSYSEPTGAEPYAGFDARRPLANPPRIDLSEMEAMRAESILADADALHIYEEQSEGSDSPASSTSIEPSPAAPAATQPAASIGLAPAPARPPSPPSLIVDWPPEGERHIVALRIVSASGERLSGRAVRLAITACGFVPGPFAIYHQPDGDGRALLSAASLSKPGVLDPLNIDFQRLAGINLFTVLPGPLAPPAALDHLIDTARELSQRLPARVQDEHGQPLDAERLEDLRDRMQSLSATGFHAEPAA